MINKSYEALLRQLHSWLHRKTINASIRRVASLPVAIATDIGIVRDENQDRIAVMKYRLRNKDCDSLVIALADGMGGMVGGANAASLTISSFFSTMIQNSHLPLQQSLDKSVICANDAVFELYSGSGGSTLSVLVIDDGEYITGLNIGDSRIYEFFDGKTTQLSEDDTIAALAQKYKSEELKLDARFSNELVQYIGQEEPLVPHFVSIKKEKTKKVILTSDGAHNIGLSNINRLVNHSANSGILIRRITELANWFGGGDNASIAVFDFYNSSFQSEKSDENIINIWDPYGELQIVNLYNFQDNVGDKNLSPEMVNKQMPSDEVLKLQSVSVKEKKVRIRSRKKNKPKLVEKVNESINDSEKKINQLDISFDNKEEGGVE
ncbi:TPA: PP2C family protein-serine/threonine phosphatase [Serratia fonticola]